MTGGTYFTGGNGVGVAMRDLGIEDVFGVEFDDKIANVARANGFPVQTADVCAIDPATLPRVDVFHASPVCKNASNAKTDGKESPEDIATAQAVCRYIEYHRPRVVTVENVWGYRTFDAFAEILKTLSRSGYKWDYWHLNSADYGVPQTRKRLILIAALDFQPTKPRATHSEEVLPMFETLEPWIGWLAALADLVPTLPPSAFADWQLDRLPQELTNVLIGGGNRSNSFLEFAKAHRADTPGKRFEAEPARTVSATASGDARAFIVSATEQRVVTARSHAQPVRTLKGGGERMARAFLMQVQGEGGDGIKYPAEPMQAVTANHGAGKYRAFLVGDQHSHGGSSIVFRDSTESAFTTDTRPSSKTRAWLDSGRVVKMTPRALARFQTLPDSYHLPRRAKQRRLNPMETRWLAELDCDGLTVAQQDVVNEWLLSDDALACTVIGNMVPVELYKAVLRTIPL